MEEQLSNQSQDVQSPEERNQVVQEVSVTHNKSDNLLNSMRRKADEAERRALEAERLVKQYAEQQAAAQSVHQPMTIEESDDIGVDNEDYVQAKHIKTSNKKISTKVSAAEKRLLELEQKLAYFEAKVDTDSIKDFNEVVSDENLKTFAKLYPDDYQTMMSNPNLKSKSKTAYNMIKNYGIMDANRSVSHALDVEQKLSQNKQKPQASSNASPQQPQTPLTRLGDYERRTLTEADRDRIMAEVERKKASW